MSTGGTYVQQVNIKANLDISQAKSQISGLESAFRKLSLPKGMENSFNKVFTKMKSDLSQVEALMQKGLTSKTDVNSFNKYTNSISTGYSKILTMINQLNGQKVTMKVDTTQIEKLKQRLTDLQKNYDNVLKGLAAGKDSGGFGSTLSSIEKIASSSKIVKTNLEGLRGTLKEGDFSAANSSLEKFVNGLTRLGSVKKLDIAKALNLSEVTKQLGNETSRWSAEQNNFFKNAVFTALTGDLNEAKVAASGLEMQMNDTAAAMNKIQNGNLEKAKATLLEMGNAAEKAAQQQQKANAEAQQGIAYQYDKQMQVNDLRMQVQYFFGLQNMINLFRKGVRDAISTVKELDKAMTATAVVTDYSVSDMWGQLPEYTKRAQQLGTTIADVYNATTLYYQQGLDTEHAMGTAVETLKMARIAGIEGAEATDLMTAALRGFRMESNEVNASHVNDVYSALAASSASDTYEIGTAMSKVASLASSANMDIETTATFLAQIIETTREAPETAGTALKTIIARFGEVKKLSQEGLFTGTDEEGEVIDINKVDTALKTAGISLQDFINGNEGLDQVFLRLAERWDSLSIVQQRYIATQAAGARMQARFIAMMQDYGRTQELLNVANNAEGAGEKQFAKTAESLEFKLNQLKDAYHSFIMGIANSTAIKTVVDVLITGFDKVNSIIQTATGGVDSFNNGLNGVLRTILSISTAYAALKVGGKALNTGVDWLGGLFLGRGAVSASRAAGNTGLFGGIRGGAASAITAPILSKLDTLISVTRINGKNMSNLANRDTGTQLSGRGFLAARKDINLAMAKGMTRDDLISNMGQYDLGSQRAIMASSPGTAQAIKKGYLDAVNKLDLKKPGQLSAKTFIKSQENAFKTGKIDFKSYVKTASMASSQAFAKYMPDAYEQTAKNAPILQQLGIDQNQAAMKAAIGARAKELYKQSISSYSDYDAYGQQIGPELTKEIKKELAKSAYAQATREADDLGSKKINLNGAQKLGNTFSNLGAGISGAGMALSAFSAQLQAMGADKAAAAVGSLGSAFTSLGMAVGGIGSLVTTIGSLGPVGIAAAAGITAVIGAAAVAYKMHQKEIKEVRDAGKQVTKDYKKNVVEQRKSLKSLTEGYEEYQKLRQGVDAKGNNISLDEEQYQRYQDYTDKLISMNGALQQGVNQTGKAYISQYADIGKVLKEEAEEADRAQQKYLTNGSAQKIANQVDTYKRLQGLFNEGEADATYGAAKRRTRGVSVGGGQKTVSSDAGKFTADALKIKDAIDQMGLSVEELNEMGLKDIDWGNIDSIDAKKIYDASDALSSYIANSDKLDESQEKTASKAVSGITKTYNDAIEASSDMTDWLETYLTSTNMDGASIEKAISDKFDLSRFSDETNSHLSKLGQSQAASLTEGFREGLEQLSLQRIQEGWSIDEFKQKATDYASSLKEISSSATESGGKYSKALIDIAKAQTKYDKAAASGDQGKAAKSYTKNIKKAITELNVLAEKYDEAAETGDTSAARIAESIREGMQQAVAYTTNGSERIQENLNVLAGSFESANSAVENYQEKTKDLKDFYTAAEGMKSILDDIGWDEEKKQLTGKEVEGHGSQKFWLAAENLVDEKVLDQGFKKVKSKITQLAPTLEEGQKGFESFLDYLDNNYDKVSKWYKKDNEGNVWFEDLDDSGIKKMADQLGVSDDYLSSMINKSRQFMGSWNLSNVEGLLSGITSAEGTITGKTTGKNGKNAYFYNYDTLRSEALAAGVTDFGKDSEFQKIVQELQSKGVKLLNIDQLTEGTAKQQKAQAKIATDLVKSNVKGWKEGSKLSGQKLENAVKPLVESGQYSADDALAILQAAGAVGTGDQAAENFSQAWDKINASPELNATNQIADNTAQTNSLLAQILAQNGTTPKEIADNIDASHEEVVGEKGVSDTWYQRFGRHQENEDGETLTYNEKKAGLTKIDAKINEAEADLKVATQAWESAKAKYGEGSDKANEEKKHVETAQSTIDELNYAKTHGGAGVTAAEALLGGNASKFKYNAIKEQDLEGLNKFDADITEFLNGGGKLNTDRVQELLAGSGMQTEAQNSILGQYARQRMYDKGFDAIKGKGITNQDIGEALNASSVSEFVEAINNSSLKKLNKKQFEDNLNLLAEQYANIHDLNKDKVIKAAKEGSPEHVEGVKENTNATTGISELNETEYNNKIDSLARQAIQIKDNLVDAFDLSTYNSDAFTKDNNLNRDNFGTLAKEITNQTKNTDTQSKIMGQYLQNNAQQLVAQNANDTQIAASIQQAADVMSQNKMEPEAIAAAINQGYGTTLTKDDITTNKNGEVEVNLKKDGLKEQLEGLTADVEARITKISAAATGQNNHRFGTFAKGSRHGYTIPGRPTLTGEEGEELVWEPRRNQAYMVGTNGPQFANISKDAVVWNAAQTKRIKKNSGSAYFGTGARGIRNFGTMGGGTKIEGKFDLDAMANITDVKDPSKKPEIPVTARIENTTNGGLANSIKSLFGKETTTEIPVTANIGEVNPPKQEVPVDAYAKVTKVTKAGTIQGEPVRVNAEANVKPVNSIKVAKGAKTTVAADTSGAIRNINALNTAIHSVPKAWPVSVTANVSGTAAVVALALAIGSVRGKDVDVTVHKKVSDETGKAGGLGKYTPHNWNSFAVGRKRSDPSFKGGLALTGEEGYEIAWLPKEGKSMILGADGPEMVDLPKDIVIWTHEESKKIAKGNRGIPIGSFVGGANSGKYKRQGSTSGGGSTGAKGTKGTIPKTTKKDDDKKTSAAVAQATGGIYKIDVQIYNLTKKIEQTANKIEKNSEDIKDKLSNSIDFSYSQISKLVKNQSSLLKTQVSDNKKLTNKYNKKLLDLGAGKGRYKKYQISYEKKVKKKGKTSKETENKKVNLGKYIKKSGDAYVLDYKALRKAAKNKKLGKNYAKAVMEAAQKEIDDLSSKKLSASKATEDAKKKLQELRKELQDTLFGWENELTKIKTLQDKITLGESFSKTMEEIQDLITKMVNPSLNNLTDLSTKYQQAVKKSIEAQKKQLEWQRDLLEAHKAQLSADLSLADEYANLKTAQDKRKGAKAGSAEWEFYNALYDQRQKELDAAQVGARLTSVSITDTGQIVVDFDWEQFNKERYDTAEGVNNLEYDKVKEYYEKIVDSVQKINDDYVEIANTIASLYDQRKDQYQMMSDYTQKIREGMEEEEQKTIDNLSDLNKSIQDAFKDLIDNVKKELDRQRKEEKNQKDEEDISNKANRLAMLRADTSGSNAAEIAQLEKELTETTGNYEDSLEDQLLDRLQDQADEAAKQREKQIELLTAQLNYSKSAGLYLAKAESLVQKIANGDTTPQTQQLARLYYLGSDKLLDKWGKVIAAQEFAGDTLKVSNFNETIAQYDKAIKDTEDAAKELLDAALNLNHAAEKFAKENLEQVKENVKANKDSLNIKDAYYKLRNEGGMELNDIYKFLKKDAGYTAKDFRDVSFLKDKVKKAGFKINDLVGVYTPKEVRKLGYTATQFKNSNFKNAEKAKTARAAGYTAQQIKDAKYGIKTFKEAGYGVGTALNVGYSRKNVIKTYGEKAVKKAEKGTRKKTTLDTNGKEKGGKISKGTVNKSGTKVAAQSKGSVFYQNYDLNKGKGTGATKEKKFSQFTASFVKNNQKEAGKALVYQLKNSKVGSKLHKKWGELIKASTYSGLKANKQVQLKGEKGTITKDGKIYHNTKKGVEIWNPAKGTNGYALKYNKNEKEFVKRAQKNKGVAREYTQFLQDVLKYDNKKLKKLNIKKYATGGKADFTGPAWLDGTPSKPELILNATDTKNFIALKDILSEATKRGVFNHEESNSVSDMNFDIDIHVDKLDSDYDVDKVIAKVKKEIIKEAKGRNVTVTGRSR